MSKKINNYIIFDFETGGLNVIPNHQKPGPANPITEFACQAIKGTTYEQILRYDNVIKPYDNSLVYTQEASALHGLTKEVCERDGIRLSQFMEDFVQICNEANTENSKIGRPMLVGHNVQFDIRFLCDVANRAKVDLSKLISGSCDYKGNFQPDYMDTLQLCKNTVGHSIDSSIKFNLGECSRRLGTQVVDGHRAMNDVIPTTEIFIQLMTRLRSQGGMASASESGVATFRQKFEI